MWTLVGVPIDSSGRNRGEANAPAALRAAGLGTSESIDDRGDLEARITDPVRDPETGVIGFEQLLAATQEIADAVATLVTEPGRPLVVGGDCSLLPGVFAGLHAAGIEAGLWMVDGHPDALDGDSSPTGEAADMELAFLLGRAPAALAELWGGGAALEAGRVALLGHRPAALSPDSARDRAGLPAGVLQLDAARVAELGPEEAVRLAIEAVGGEAAWLHLDLDAIDEREFAAVTYPQPQGLSLEEFGRLAELLAGAESLVGMSVADLEPDRDHDGWHARAVAGLIERLPA